MKKVLALVAIVLTASCSQAPTTETPETGVIVDTFQIDTIGMAEPDSIVINYGPITQ